MVTKTNEYENLLQVAICADPIFMVDHCNARIAQACRKPILQEKPLETGAFVF